MMKILIVIISLWLRAEAEGFVFHPVTLPDQFGKEHRIDGSNCSLLLIANSKKTSEKFKEFFIKRKKDFSRRHHICLIFDLHTVPGLVRRWILLPKMRDYPFEVLVIKESSLFPMKEGKITAIVLKHDNTVTSVHFIEDMQGMFDE